MMDKHFFRQFSQIRSFIETELILVLNCHNIMLTHFKFYESFSLVVFKAVV